MQLDFVPRLGLALCALLVTATAHAQGGCDTDSQPSPQVLEPLADGFVVPGQRLLGAAGFDRAHSVERVLHRRQLEACRQAIAAALTPVAAPVYRDDYIKQTEFDNTPYRFNMTQDGKRMTADDFDAWLKSNGYSVGRRAEPAVAQDISP